MSDKVISIDEYHSRQYEKRVADCLADVQGHLLRWEALYDPLVIAVAIGDHFREQVSILVDSGQLSPEEAEGLVPIRQPPSET